MAYLAPPPYKQGKLHFHNKLCVSIKILPEFIRYVNRWIIFPGAQNLRFVHFIFILIKMLKLHLYIFDQVKAFDQLRILVETFCQKKIILFLSMVLWKYLHPYLFSLFLSVVLSSSSYFVVPLFYSYRSYFQLFLFIPDSFLSAFPLI